MRKIFFQRYFRLTELIINAHYLRKSVDKIKVETVENLTLANCFLFFIESYNKPIGVFQYSNTLKEVNKAELMNLFRRVITMENILPLKRKL
jgi:hypothetical protein